MMTTKTCRICGSRLSLEHFVINHTTPVKKHYKDICKVCSYSKKKVVDALKKIHPYPDVDYVCPICNKADARWYLDHDWATGKFRGWLCNGCNVALGLMKDSRETLKAAISYLDET